MHNDRRERENLTLDVEDVEVVRMMSAAKHATFRSNPHTAGTQTPRSLLSDPSPRIDSDNNVKKRVNIVDENENGEGEGEGGGEPYAPKSLFEICMNLDKVREAEKKQQKVVDKAVRIVR